MRPRKAAAAAAAARVAAAAAAARMSERPPLPSSSGRDVFSPRPSEAESYEALDGGESPVLGEEGSRQTPSPNDLADARLLNFVGATIRDASYPGDEPGEMFHVSRAGSARESGFMGREFRSGRRNRARASRRATATKRRRTTTTTMRKPAFLHRVSRPAPTVAPSHLAPRHLG